VLTLKDENFGTGRNGILNDKILLTNEKEFFYFQNGTLSKVDLFYQNNKIET
jgi:hypothetical protein